MMPDIERVQAALAYIPAHDRDTWLRMGMAVKSELGEDGFGIWNDWSQSADNYQERDAKAVWRSIRPTGKVTAGTLLYEAQQNGWKPTGAYHEPNPAEVERQRKQGQERDRAEAEKRQQIMDQARIQAGEIWNRCKAAPEDHPYLRAKGIRAASMRLYNGPLAISGMKCDGALVVPLRDTGGTLHTLEFISASGEKKFLPNGAKSGHYFALPGGDPDTAIIIAEGAATAASISQATDTATAAAIDAGNLKPVALALRAKYPDTKIVIAADNDAWTDGNPGAKNATEAAQAVNARLAVPTFKDASSNPTDFNDLHKLEGLDAVRAQIEGAPQAEAGVLALSALPTPDVWENPRPIDSSLYQVSRLDPQNIPEPYRKWLEDVADRMQCPIDFVAASALVMTSAVIGAGCGIRPKREDDWTVIPNLWGGVIGNPSRLKTPAISAALYPLSMLEKRANKEYEDAQRSYEAEAVGFEAHKSALRDKMKKEAPKGGAEFEKAKRDFANITEPTPPKWRRYRSNDPSIEKMGELLRDNPKGLMLFRDELTGTLASWDKQGRETDRAFYLEAWNGYGSFTTDRIGRGTIHVENLCVSIFGGIQPAKLTGYLYRAMREHDNDGLMQRIQVLVYPDDLSGWQLVDRRPDQAAQSRAFDIVRRLAEMDYTQHGATYSDGNKTPWFRFDPEAQELFYAWWSELERDKLRGNCEAIVKEHMGKYRSLFPSLALIFHLIDIADGKASGPVTLTAATLAADWCEYLENHARRVYGMVSNIIPRAAAVLLGKIRAGNLPDPFTTRHVYRPHWELLDHDNAAEVCEYLEALGWIRDVTRPYEVGRPPATEYAINPKAKRAV